MRGAFLGVSYNQVSNATGYGPGSLKRIQRVAQQFLMCEPVWPDAKLTGLWLGAHTRNVGQYKAGNTTVFLNNVPRDAPAPEDFSSLIRDVTAQYSPELAQGATRMLKLMVPPFGLVQFSVQDSAVVAATDYLGYHHLYWYQGDGWAAISNSALALAQCGEVKLDEEALANRSLLGYHLSESTPFQGIRKLGPAGFCVLNHGRANVGAYADAISLRGVSVDRSLKDVACDVADQLKGTMTRYVEEHPDLVLQLSGGLDSRVEFAAIPPNLRPGLRAITLSSNNSCDAPIAARLANAAGFQHRIVPMELISDLDPVSAWRLVRQEAICHSCSGDPVAHAVLGWAEGQLGNDEPRVHGTGGEIIRGFYYEGLRQRNTVRRVGVSRLAKWRLFSNDVVEAECLGPARAEWAKKVTVSRLQEIFDEYDCDWLTSTDMFYTFQRMSRWAGLSLTTASAKRTLLSPLIDPQFIRAALSCSPQYKRGSRLMAFILYELDPDLASAPLDSGYVPIQVARGTAFGRLRSLKVTSRKVARKVKQQVSRSTRTSGEAEIIAHLVLSHWRAAPDLFNTATRAGVISPEWLEQVLESRRTPDAATIGYLANLQVISEHMNQRPL